MTNALEIGVAPAGEILGEARAALGEVVPALARLVRGIPDPQAAAVGTWTTGEVAAHLTHVLAGDADAIAGRPLPAVSVTVPVTEPPLSAAPARLPSAIPKSVTTARSVARSIMMLSGFTSR